MSYTLHVPMVLARNPVARAVERQRLKAWHTNTALEIQLMQPDAFLADGFTEDEIRTMAVANTRRLAGLEPLAAVPIAGRPEAAS